MTVDDLQDGTVLLKVVYMLKKEPNSCVINTIEDRFQLIADFVKNMSGYHEIFERSATASSSNVSTMPSLSDDDSPVFRRRQKISFMDMQTVASSSTRVPYLPVAVRHGKA
ncbi:hypothetical protein JOQ06_021081 [Pogonophryne albipinna]|uniref:Nuclear mitotic apparatus protein 1 N-terminal hook domain-containing protein n=1 Tax=Pogonophryne albipinna TaxID=1090488 RepID=A0AAD6BR98_9TELE|nr:hypothetical protein JOQ06_021081 [Pogonophryne albipinna]